MGAQLVKNPERAAKITATALVALMAATVFFAARALLAALGVGFGIPLALVLAAVFIVAVWRKAMGFAEQLVNEDD